MTERATVAKTGPSGSRRARIGLVCIAALSLLWLGLASRIHVNASWSDGAWGYAAVPLFGADPAIGDRVLFDPPAGVRRRAGAVSEDGARRAGHVRHGR